MSNHSGQSTWWIVLLIFLIVSLTIFIVIRQMDRHKEEVEQAEWSFPAIQVEVRNGCGFPGVAGNVRDNCAIRNIDVINVSTARKFLYDETLIVVKHDDAEDLSRLQMMTGIKNVIYAINETYYVPFIIIAGKDYQKYFYTITRT